MQNFIVVIFGHSLNGEAPSVVVKAWPYWEHPDMTRAVADCCVAFANEFGTGDFTVEVREINP